MNIVIFGAGSLGAYLASTLSAEENNVILIDPDQKKLEQVSRSLDVMIRTGKGTDWQLLDDLLELSPQLFLALSSDDETNLAACCIAKNLGYPQTIAQIRDEQYYNRTHLDFEHIFETDHFVGPEILAAYDIYKTIMSPGSVAIETFAHGAVQMRTIEVPDKWKKGDRKLYELELPKGVMVGLIRRRESEQARHGKYPSVTIFPHGNDSILPGDEVTFIGETDVISGIHQHFGLVQKPIRSAVLVGGSVTAVSLARLLERQGVQVKLIEKDYDRCCELAELLSLTTVTHQDGTDLDFLLSERVEEADVFVTCTMEDDVNLLSAVLAKEAGCSNVVGVISNTRYISVIQQLGISHAVSPRVSAANRILSLARSQMVTSMVSLYENTAEILEVKVSHDSKFVGIPISELGPQLPSDFLIAVIQNRGRIMIANGNRILSPGDTMIVITSPKHIREFHKVF